MVDLKRVRDSDKVENRRGETEGQKLRDVGLNQAYEITLGPYVDFYNWLTGRNTDYADPVGTAEEVGLHSPDQEYDYANTGRMAGTTGFKENEPAYRGRANPELASERGNINDFYNTFLDDPKSMSKYPNAFMEIARAAAATGNKYAPGTEGAANKGYTPQKLLRSPENVEPPPDLIRPSSELEGNSMATKASAGHTFRQSDRPGGWLRTLDSEKRYQDYLDATKDLPVDPDAYFKPGYPGRFPEGRPDVLPEEPAVGKGYPYSRASYRGPEAKITPDAGGSVNPPSKFNPIYSERYQGAVEEQYPDLFQNDQRAGKFPMGRPPEILLRPETKRPEPKDQGADISGEAGSDTLLGRGKKDTLKSGQPTTTSAYKAFGGPLLRVGIRNDVNQVKEWQQFLADHGYYAGKIDGSFGPRTRAATKLLQSDAGIKGREVDGIVGPQTKHLASTMASRSVATARGPENFEDTSLVKPEDAEAETETGLKGPTSRPINSPVSRPQSGPLDRFTRPRDALEEALLPSSTGPAGRPNNRPYKSDDLVVLNPLPPEPKIPPADFATRFDTELPTSYGVKNSGLPEGLTPEEVQRAGSVATPPGEVTPFKTPYEKNQDRLPTVAPDAGTKGYPAMTPAPSGSLKFGAERDGGVPAPGTVPASGRITPEPSAPLPSMAPPTTEPDRSSEPLSPGSAGFDETFGTSSSSGPTSLGQILSLSGGASSPPTTAAGAEPSTDIGGLVSSASQSEAASQAINATPQTSTPSSAPSTTSTTPSTTVAPSGGQTQISPDQLGRLIAQATGGMTGDEARASAYSSAYG